MSTLINKEAIVENYKEAMGEILDTGIFPILPEVTDDMVGEVVDAMHDTHDNIMRDAIQQIIDNVPVPCPVCKKTDTVEWQTTEMRISEALGANDFDELELDVQEHIRKDTDMSGGSWKCNFLRGGCGAESGWKEDNSNKSWLNQTGA